MSNIQLKTIRKNFDLLLIAKKVKVESRGSLYHNRVKLSGPLLIVDEFSSFFSSAFSKADANSADMTTETDSNLPLIGISHITIGEVNCAAGKLKNKITCGPNKLPIFFVKYCANAFVFPLSIIFYLSN